MECNISLKVSLLLLPATHNGRSFNINQLCRTFTDSHCPFTKIFLRKTLFDLQFIKNNDNFLPFHDPNF